MNRFAVFFRSAVHTGAVRLLPALLIVFVSPQTLREVRGQNAGAANQATEPAEFRKERLRIDENAHKIVLRFSDTEALQLGKLDGYVAGIQWVVCNGAAVIEMPDEEVVPTPVIEWVDTSKPFRPVRDWDAYLQSRKGNEGRWPSRGRWHSHSLELGTADYVGTESRGAEAVVRFRTEAGEIRWVFSHRTNRVGDAEYRGIGWRLEVDNVPHVVWAHFREPLPLAEDHWYLAQTWGRAFIERRLDPRTKFTLPLTQQFAFHQPFLFIAGEEACLFDWFDRPTAARETIERDGDFLVRSVAIPFATGSGRATPTKYWQVARARTPDRWTRIDRWTQSYEFLAARYRQQREHGRCEPLPCTLAVTPESDYIHFLQHGRPPRVPWLERFAADELPELARIGVRLVYIAAPWESDAEHDRRQRRTPTRMPDGPVPRMEEIGSQHAPWDLKISPAIGGPESLKKLVAAAHRLGVQIVLWCGPAHLSLSSPQLIRHPDWPIWRQDGTPDDQDYNDLVGMSLSSGFGPFSIERYRDVRRKTGIDGLFFDSYLTFGAGIDFSQKQPHPQLDEMLNIERALWRMDLRQVHLEGVGVLGVGVGGFGYETTAYLGRPFPEEVRQFRKIRGREYGLYRFVADTFLEPDSYYRALASKGMICIFDLRQFHRLDEDQRRWIGRANREYLAVLDQMENRHLIGDGDRWQGVAWTRNGATDQVIFAFEAFDVDLGQRGIVEDLTSGDRRPVDSRFRTEAWHTYRVHCSTR